MVCYSKAEAWFFGGRTLTYRNESNLLIYHGSSLYYNPAAARAKNIKNKTDLVWDREYVIQDDLKSIENNQPIRESTSTYRKIASSNTSCLEAHAGFFRLLRKGIFVPYVLWYFEKKLIF